MKLKAALFVALIIIAAFTLNTSNAQAKPIQIYVNSDGSISPETGLIVFDGEKYLLTADITGSITVERSNILLDGAGHTIQGDGEENGVLLQHVTVYGSKT